jgi:hypothetical protein
VSLHFNPFPAEYVESTTVNSYATLVCHSREGGTTDADRAFLAVVSTRTCDTQYKSSWLQPSDTQKAVWYESQVTGYFKTHVPASQNVTRILHCRSRDITHTGRRGVQVSTTEHQSHSSECVSLCRFVGVMHKHPLRLKSLFW